MKSLPQFVEDMKATADLLREQADGLDELVNFFGGVAKMPAPPPVQRPAPPRPTPSPPPPPPPPPAAAAAPPAEEPPPEKRKRGGPPGRMLTKAEKKEILEDWNEIPPPLRTKTNRAALAAKYNCSPVQVYAITRDPEELRKNLQGGKQAQALMNALPPRPSESLSKSHGVQ